MCTLLKASVYSIVLQQQIFNESEEQARADEEEQLQFGYQGQDRGPDDYQGQGGGEGGFYGDGDGEGDVTFG